MMQDSLIPTELICRHHRIEQSFIHSLHEYGLIQITEIESGEFIYSNQLQDLERMIRLHYDLEINLEGIDAITHLVKRIEALQDELNALKNRLHFYEKEL